MSGEWQGRRLHFIGIGGAGMSGLALVCSRLGASVSGSDRSDSSYMERLRAASLDPIVGHDAANLPEGEVEVVRSSAIGPENPEWQEAVSRGLRAIHRGELLAELCAEKRLIAVAGTHGKTTTTAMLAWGLRAAGVAPSFFIGGEVPGLGPQGASANAGWEEGEWVLAEADESDASFLALQPEIAIVTNVEMDHHSHWGSLAELTDAFRSFLAPAAGVVLPLPEEAAPGRAGEQENPPEVLYREMVGTKQLARFGDDQPAPTRLDLAVRGRHNLLNARAALAAAGLAGLDVEAVAAGLADFPGVGRRLEYKGQCAGARVYDDYAHHPTEVRAALEALREERPARLIAVFQPHLYSRTKALAREFGAALALADEVIVLDVYPAREEPVGRLAGVSGKLVADAAFDRMGGRAVCWAPSIEEAQRAARRGLGPGQAVVTIGAGDVVRVAEALVGEEERPSEHSGAGIGEQRG